MAAQTAQIIDLEEHRRVRRGNMMPDQSQDSQRIASAMVMVPVWFVPTYFIGTPPTWG